MIFNKNLLASLVLLSLTACGDGGSDEDTSTPTPDNPTQEHKPASVAEALQVLDKSGKYPALNRDATMMGPDTNNNSIRDDLEAYIASLPDTPQQKAAMLQMTAAISQSLVIDTDDEMAVIDVMNQISRASSCLHARYDKNTNDASNKNSDMEKFSVNTRERYNAYMAFNSAANGHSIVSPQGSGCDN